MLVRRVVEAAVARPVGNDGAAPRRPDDVHVAGAGLEHEAQFFGRRDLAHRGQKAAHEWIAAIAAPGRLVGAEAQGDGGERAAGGGFGGVFGGDGERERGRWGDWRLEIGGCWALAASAGSPSPSLPLSLSLCPARSAAHA